MNLRELKNDFNPKRVLPVVAILILAAVVLLSVSRLSDMRRRADSAENAVVRLTAEAEIMSELQGRLDTRLRRIRSAPAAGGILPLLEDLSNRLGVSKLVTRLKPGEARRKKGFSESSAELSLEKADLNQVVNLLYKIENNASYLVIRKLEIRKNFQNAERFDLSITVSLIQSASTG